MKLLWSPDAWADYRHWQASDPDLLVELNALIDEVRRSPFRGLGKPEPMRGELSGWWSRRKSIGRFADIDLLSAES